MLIKKPDEIIKMRKAGKLAAQVLEMISEHVKVGVTTKALDQKCHQFIINDLNAIPSTLNHHGFPASICTSVNHVVCHGIPNKKPLKNGDILNIDVTVKKDGYIGDTSKMFCIGNTSTFAQRLVDTTQTCLYKAIALLKPGIQLGDIGHCIQQHAEQNRLQIVREFCGHGIGQAMWEEPQILHYGKPQQGLTLQAGMIFTIEPMLNLGTRKVKTLSDGWTVVTQDRKLSAQWEHTLLITDNACEVLTKRAEEVNLP